MYWRGKPQMLTGALLFLSVIISTLTVPMALSTTDGMPTSESTTESSTAVIEYNFEQTSYTVTEGDDHAATVHVIRTGTSGASSVDVMHLDGTAVWEVDYFYALQTLSFSGINNRMLTEPYIFDDAIPQDTHCFSLILENPVPSDARIGENSTAEICIIDNDVSAPEISTSKSTTEGLSTIKSTTESSTEVIEYNFEQTSYTVTEGDVPPLLEVHVIRTGATNSDSTSVEVVSIDGTAVLGIDYVHSSPETLSFSGSKHRTFTGSFIIDDQIPQDTHCFRLILVDPVPSDASIGENSTAEICIIDNDVSTSESTTKGLSATESPTESSTEASASADMFSVSSTTKELSVTESTADGLVTTKPTTEGHLNTESTTDGLSTTHLTTDGLSTTESTTESTTSGSTSTMNEISTRVSTTFGLSTIRSTRESSTTGSTADAVQTSESATEEPLIGGSTAETSTQGALSTTNVVSTRKPTTEGLRTAGSATESMTEGLTSTTDTMSTSDSTTEGHRTTKSTTESSTEGSRSTTDGMSAIESTTESTTGSTMESTTVCPLSESSCMNGGTFDEENCECVCPLTHAGAACEDANQCETNSGLCSGPGEYCLPAINVDGYTCQCRPFDGFFLVANSCQRRPSLSVVITVLGEVFRAVYNNPTSAAFRNRIALYARLVLLKLQEDSATRTVVSIQGTAIQPGSLIVSLVAQFPVDVDPPRNDIVRVLSVNELTDGNVTIPINPSSVRVNDASTACTPGYCHNGGTCVKSGNFFPNFDYSCSCGTSFTGELCETVIPVLVDDTTTTQTPSPTNPAGGLSTEATVLIIVGSTLLFMVAALLVCLCFQLQRQYEAGLALRRPVTSGHDSGRLWTEYGDHSRFHYDPQQLASWKEEVRMNSLMHVMRQSPYLQQSLPVRQDFIRPYMASGEEALYHEDQMVRANGRRVAGRVAYIPRFYY